MHNQQFIQAMYVYPTGHSGHVIPKIHTGHAYPTIHAGHAYPNNPTRALFFDNTFFFFLELEHSSFISIP